MNFKCSYTHLLELHKIVANPRNTNKHPEKQIDMLAKIIDYNGQRSPIVISKRSGFITKGHARLLAIMKLGWEKAAVDFQDYENEASEYADLEADNRIAELAERDEEKAAQNIKDIFESGFDMELLGMGGPIDLGNWDSDIEKIEGIGETSDGPAGKITISCKNEDKDEIIEILQVKFKEYSFENIVIK